MIASVVRFGLQLVSVGIGAGVIGGLVAGRMLGGLLYGVTPSDTQVLIVSCVTVAGAALMACLVPALSAARIDPMKVLRQE